MTAVAMCANCRGRRHLFDKEARRWVACACARGMAEVSGACGIERAMPLTSFGPKFSEFYRRSIEYPGPSWLCGPMPLLGEAAASFLSAAASVNQVRGKLLRLGDAVDAYFDKGGGKARLLGEVERFPLLVLLCGTEPKHAWNESVIAEVAERRRGLRKPTIFAATGDLVTTYGEKTAAVFDGAPRAPRYLLRPVL